MACALWASRAFLLRFAFEPRCNVLIRPFSYSYGVQGRRDVFAVHKNPEGELGRHDRQACSHRSGGCSMGTLKNRYDGLFCIKLYYVRSYMYFLILGHRCCCCCCRCCKVDLVRLGNARQIYGRRDTIYVLSSLDALVDTRY